MTTDIKTTLPSRILFFLLCATLVFSTLAYGTVHQPIISLFYLIGVLTVILWALDSFRTGVLRFNKNLIQIPLAAAVIYGFIQIIPFGSLAEIGGLSGIARTISLEPFWTKMFALHFFVFLIFLAALLVYTDSAKRLRRIVWLITIFGFVYAFFAILQYVLSPDKIYGIYELKYAKPFGSFVNRHNFAAYMEMTMAVPLGLMFAGAVPRDKRLLVVTAIALMGVALILSGSRGGLVAFLAEIFFMLILTTETKSYGQLVVKVGLAVLLLATIIAGSILIGGESSLTRIAETAASNDITTNRTHIWNITLSVIRTYPLFGTGLGGFSSAYTNFDTLNGMERVEQAHNDYLQILSDAGLVGLIIAAFFVFQLFRNGLKNAKTVNLFRRGVAVGALAGCFAILIHSLFDFVLHTSAVAYLFVTLVALTVVSGNKFIDDSDDGSKRRHRKSRSASVTPIEAKRRR
ncbi:MAG TPA: O-antigen ligase family protein [Pyrinomonadaceae bacterium]|jgi:O-antigen ligase